MVDKPEEDHAEEIPLAEEGDSEMPDQEESKEEGEGAEEEKKTEERVTELLESTEFETEKTLIKDFGYYQKDGDHFLQVENDEVFKFVDQKHYEALGDAQMKYIEERMTKDYGLERQLIPSKTLVKEGESQCPIFVSPNYIEKSKIMVLIQGTGDVRAGIWARSVCMNQTLTLGSVLPQLEFAREHDMGVIVMNPNYRCDEDDKPVPSRIMGMERHSLYVWERYLEDHIGEHDKELFFIAHSAGGACMASIIRYII